MASLSRPDVVEGELESGVLDRGLVLTGSGWKRCSSEFEEGSYRLKRFCCCVQILLNGKSEVDKKANRETIGEIERRRKGGKGEEETLP